MLVYYENQLWVLDMVFTEEFFLEIKSLEPHRLMFITKGKKTEVVQIVELEVASERRAK